MELKKTPTLRELLQVMRESVLDMTLMYSYLLNLGPWEGLEPVMEFITKCQPTGHI